MALILTRNVLLHKHITKNFLHGFLMAHGIRKIAIISYHASECLAEKGLRMSPVLDVSCRRPQFVHFQPFSCGTKPERISWGASSHAILLRKLEVSLENHQMDEAWVSFNDFKSLYGFPKDYLLSKMITELCYSSHPHWLQKAYNLAVEILKEKPRSFQNETLTTLTLCLARAQMPIPASMILRVMMDKENMPSISLFQMIILHMVKSKIGTYLASNILIQICECFLRLRKNKFDLAKVIRPDTTTFNLVLDACVRFNSSLKGQELLEWMSQTSVVADAQSIIIIAQIYEINGLRDEVKKFKDQIDCVPASFTCHFRQVYECMLNLHFKFDDLEAATELLLDMNRFWGSNPDKKSRMDIQKPCLVSIGSQNLRAGLKIQIMPELLQKDFTLNIEDKKELVIFENGKFLLTNKALAKLIHGYRRYEIINELSKVLVSMEKNMNHGGSNLCSGVIDAFIHLGWLETAHDIMDDMEITGIPLGLNAYMALLTAYYSRDMYKEAEALLKQMRKAGLVTNFPVNIGAATYLSKKTDDKSSSVNNSDLVDLLVQEMRKEAEIPPKIFELNSSIYFFCKVKMMEDALKTYRRMQVVGIQPTEKTFAYLVYGCSSLGRYRDITILWGDIKRNMKNKNMTVNRDLYETLLMNFLQCGYFERVMEVVSYMEEHNIYTDKEMCKSEFMKLHKNLYKGLKASDARNEVQRKRIEFVQNFRKWVGND